MKEYLEQHGKYMDQLHTRLQEALILRTEIEVELREIPDTTRIFHVVTDYVVELGLEIRDLQEALERERKWHNLFLQTL